VRTTFHLVPEEVWAGLDTSQPYRHESLEREGFIHCTDGADAMCDTANRHYGNDPRPFVVLTVDLDAAGSPWRIDEPGSPYPHVYGPIDRAAILDVRPMPRNPDGTFRPPR
jgi:uncharacterized protein (DUF952 family)